MNVHAPHPDIATALAELVRTEVARMLEAGATNDPWLSVAGAARYADVSIATLRRWIREGFLKVGHAGADPRIRRSEVDRYLERREGDRSLVDRLLEEVANG